jgi:hypothetical protein
VSVRKVPDNFEVMDDAMVAVYRGKSVAEKLAIAHGMWRYARSRIEAAVRWQHPEWDDLAVRREVSRRLLRGSDGPVEPPAGRR